MHAVLRSLHVYPVKSLRGITLDTATLTPLGLEHDRAWLLVDAKGRFMSQRQYPDMARIGTRITRDSLELATVGQAPLNVSLETPNGNRLHTRVWDDYCEVLDEGDDVSQWFAAALRMNPGPRLVRMAPGFKRSLKRPEREGEGTTTCFADTAPLLVTNLASLERLNEVLVARGLEPVPMDRFRANLVVEGLTAFSEHGVECLEGPDYRLGLRYPRERCVMTTMDQSTGTRDPTGQPFALLQEINPMPDNTQDPAFGELAVVESGAGQTLATGHLMRVRTRDSAVDSS